MIKHEVLKQRKRQVWLEVEELGWAILVEEVWVKQGTWDKHTMRVPIDGLRNAVAKVTIQHEVGR